VIRLRGGLTWLVLLVVSAIGAFAANALLSGDVYYQSGQPAVNCTVSVGSQFAFTDVNGRYRIANVPPGNYSLTVSRQGKVLKELSIKVDGTALTIDRITIPQS
jgi:hypothetical protein